MSDLESLFGASGRMSPRRPGPRSEQSNADQPVPRVVTRAHAQDARVRDIQRLVGSVRDEAAVPPADLSQLVGAPQVARREASADLSRVVGPRASTGEVERSRRPGRDSVGLAALVGSAGARPDQLSWSAPETARAGKRPMFSRRRAGAVNIVSVAVSILAVLVLVAAASVALIQRATANPADDAMASLREREAELTNEIDQLRTAMDLYSVSLESARASTVAARDVLPRVGERLSPGSMNDAQSAQAAVERLAAQPASVSLPAYSRGSINERSLVDVGHALDKVREIENSLPDMMAAVRDARADLMAALTTFRGSLVPVGKALQTTAAERVADASAADESFRAAVAAASGELGNVQAAGGDGLAEMSAVVAALGALDVENQRVLDERRSGTEGTSRGTTVPRSTSPSIPRVPSPTPSAAASPTPAPQATTPPDPQPLPSESASASASASPSASA